MRTEIRTETLADLRAQIRREAPYIGRRRFSHNIIGLLLNMIAKKFGRDEANKAIRDFKLERKGFNEEPENG